MPRSRTDSKAAFSTSGSITRKSKSLCESASPRAWDPSRSTRVPGGAASDSLRPPRRSSSHQSRAHRSAPRRLALRQRRCLAWLIWCRRCECAPHAATTRRFSSTWRASRPHDLRHLSCPSVSLCVAVDAVGNILTSTQPTGDSSAWTATALDRPRITSIACPSTRLCLAGDENGTSCSAPASIHTKVGTVVAPSSLIAT